MTVAPGTRFIEEGAPGEALYVVLSGEVEVIKDDDGRDIVLAARGPGEVLGEMSLLEQRPRTASVRAVRDSEVLEIGAETFRAAARDKPVDCDHRAANGRGAAAQHRVLDDAEREARLARHARGGARARAQQSGGGDPAIERDLERDAYDYGRRGAPSWLMLDAQRGRAGAHCGTRAGDFGAPTATSRRR